MSLTAAELSALDALFIPGSRSLDEILTALGVDPSGYAESMGAQREFAEYILAVAIEDLYLAGALNASAEVVHIARKYWPAAAAATNEEN